MNARATKETVIELNYPAEQVFPLLCPVREHEWLEPWSAEILYSKSGLAEKDCVFTTQSEQGPTIWVITQCLANEAIAMVSLQPNSYTRNLEVQLKPTSSGCQLHWRLVYTAITPEGETFIQQHLDQSHQLQMNYMEQALKHFLQTGSCLTLEMHHAHP